MKKLRVLIIAEAANPEWTSVPLIGWKMTQALAEVADVHFVTHLRNRDAIVKQGLVEGRDFTAINNERVTGPLARLVLLLGGRSGKGWTTRTAIWTLGYYSFEIELWRQFSDRLKRGEFDIVHRVTPLSPTSPSILARKLARIGVPFVIGPLNGGVPWPKHFKNVQYAEREWLSHVRKLFKLLPGYRRTRKYSSAIIVGSEFTLSEMPRWSASKCVYIPENAVDLASVEGAKYDPPQLPLKAAFVGRLVPYKGADIMIEAASEFVKKGQLRLHVVGDGPQMQELVRLVDRLKLAACVTFHGWLSHVEAQALLRTCDVMILPSIREFGGGVVIEAMAQGVTPIVADYGGPSELVDASTGIKVAFEDRASLINGVRDAIRHVVESPDLLPVLGRAAREKVAANLTWQAKARQILEVYQAVLAKNENLQSLGYRARLRAGMPTQPSEASPTTT